MANREQKSSREKKKAKGRRQERRLSPPSRPLPNRRWCASRIKARTDVLKNKIPASPRTDARKIK